MTVEIIERDDFVDLTVIADNGGSSSATVVGVSADYVRNHAQSFIDAHDLDTKAQEDGQ
jgi:hypothetical protein